MGYTQELHFSRLTKIGPEENETLEQYAKRKLEHVLKKNEKYNDEYSKIRIREVPLNPESYLPFLKEGKYNIGILKNGGVYSREETNEDEYFPGPDPFYSEKDNGDGTIDVVQCVDFSHEDNVWSGGPFEKRCYVEWGDALKIIVDTKKKWREEWDERNAESLRYMIDNGVNFTMNDDGEVTAGGKEFQSPNCYCESLKD